MTTSGAGGKPVRLGNATLAQVRAGVSVPTYERARVRPRLVHIGVGGFHRAHQAVYQDELLQYQGPDVAWGICGLGLLGRDARMRDVLSAQDGLYTVIERDSNGDRARVVGSIVDYRYAPDDAAAVLQTLASDDCRIVSLTITEGGYYLNDATGAFDDAHPDVVRDLARPHAPRSSFGFLVEALDRRRNAGRAPFTVMSCDNVEQNGDVARQTTLAFAERRGDPALVRWIGDNVAFPNSMVDRIVPATTDEHRALAADSFGIDDDWPVGTELFRQWVIEDCFCDGKRPAWEIVGAQMTTDVTPYEKAKMRLLNGGHQALCWIGQLLGYELAHEAIRDPDVARLVRHLMVVEVLPLLATPAGMPLDAYVDTLHQRLANATLRDQLARIATDGSARMPKFVLPSLAEQLERGGPIDGLAFTVAAWFHALASHDEQVRPFRIVDARRDRLVAAARSVTPVESLFAMHDLFDAKLAESARLRSRVTDLLQRIRDSGCRVTLQHLLDNCSGRSEP